MFDIGFWELCLIATVALLVLGPERLPAAARTAGKWVAKIRNMVSNVKNEIDRELQLDDIRRKMAEQEEKLREQSGIDDFKETVDETLAHLNPSEQTIHQHNANSETPDTESTDDPQLKEPEDNGKAKD